eukprot:UN18493
MFPAVSAMGMEGTQKTIYQFGFASTGILFGFCIYLFSLYTKPILSEQLSDAADKDSLETAVKYGIFVHLVYFFKVYSFWKQNLVYRVFFTGT